MIFEPLVRYFFSKLLGSEFRARVAGDFWTTCASPCLLADSTAKDLRRSSKLCIAEFGSGASRVLVSHRLHASHEVGKMVVLTSALGLSGVHAHREFWKRGLDTDKEAVHAQTIPSLGIHTDPRNAVGQRCSAAIVAREAGSPDCLEMLGPSRAPGSHGVRGARRERRDQGPVRAP